MTTPRRLPRKTGSAALALAAFLALIAANPQSAAARDFHHRFHGGGFHHHGLGVGAAVGLGVLGAAAAGAAAGSYYNGYPVYPEGAHSGYGYDYYPDHGGYYGPY